MDNSTVRNITLDADRAHAGAFTAGSPSNGAPMPLHGKWVKVRGVWGSHTAGGPTRRMFLPCATVAKMNDLFAAGTFTVGVQSFNVTGKRGEKLSVEQPLP